MSIQPKNTLNKPSEFAIKVQNVSKTFRIPHERVNTLKGAFVSALRKKSFEEFKALDDISFEVKKGEFFGIIGRNGSGKSTLLKILAGIYQADCGRIQINGRISPFLELGIGFNPELSGRDNIYLNASVLGLTKKQIDKKFDEIVAFSELSRFIDQKLKNYSSGMQVRLAFSVSIHANRDILLMDEVLAVGDVNFQAKCLEEFLKLKEMGKTVILVSHDIVAVEKYCDQIMLMRSGQIRKKGDAPEVIAEYVNESICDDEERLDSEKMDKKTVINKQAKKIARVTCAWFSDRNGESKNVFRTGEILIVDVEYEIKELLENPIFGLIIHDGLGNNVFALNTQHKKMNTGKIYPGIRKISFVIDNYFATGTYSISPAVATNSRRILDWVDNLSYFRVVNAEFSSNAIADFKAKIIIS